MTVDQMISQAAAAVGRAYSTWISSQDVRQQLWLWTAENKARVEDYLTRPDGEKILRSVLNKEARTYALKERAAMSGYTTDELAWYTPREIRSVLPDVFDYEDWQSFESLKGDGRGGKPVEATGDRLSTIIDVKGALDTLLPEQVTLLREHYGRGASVAACALVLGITEEACRKRVDRAVYAISDRLNGVRQGDLYEATQGQFDTRSKWRRAMSNAAARAKTDHNWDD